MRRLGSRGNDLNIIISRNTQTQNALFSRIIVTLYPNHNLDGLTTFLVYFLYQETNMKVSAQKINIMQCGNATVLKYEMKNEWIDIMKLREK